MTPTDNQQEPNSFFFFRPNEEEYTPSPKEESTDSDCSVELSMENKEKNTLESLSQSRCKSSSQSRCKSSSRSFKTGIASKQSFPDSRADVNEECMAQTHTNKEASI